MAGLQLVGYLRLPHLYNYFLSFSSHDALQATRVFRVSAFCMVGPVLRVASVRRLSACASLIKHVDAESTDRVRFPFQASGRAGGLHERWIYHCH
jgi:hypothetical protein